MASSHPTRKNRDSAKRNGVTLLEILLVVAVIAILSAIALPLWDVMLQSEKVSRAADILRAELGATRVLAIQEGEEYVFCYVPESNQFWKEPLSASMGMAPAGMDTSVANSPVTDQLAIPPANHLPSGVIFYQGVAEESVRSQQLEEEEGAATNSNRIIFYPDGTAQTAGIIIRNDYGDALQVTLRGLTGGTSVSGWLEIE